MPSPPRYRSLRRWTLIALALVGWNVGLWLIWSFEADRRLAAFVAERRALGEPVVLADFPVLTSPGAPTAAQALAAVGDEILRARPIPRWFWPLDRDVSLWDWQFDATPATRARIDSLISKTRAAAAQPEFAFRAATTPAGVSPHQAELELIVEVVKFMRAAGRVKLRECECEEAWRILGEIAGIGSRLVRTADDPFDTYAMVSVLTQYSDLLSDLLVSDCPQDVLIDAVRREDRRLRSAVESRAAESIPWLKERAILLEDSFRRLPPSAFYWSGVVRAFRFVPLVLPPPLELLSHAIRPQVKLIALRGAREFTVAAAVDRGGTFDRRLADRLSDRRTPALLRFRSLTVANYQSSIVRYLHDRTMRSLTLARIASTTLAIRMFERDFQRLPESLDELRGAYLDETPPDPFADVGVMLSYPPDMSPPRLFSAGPSGIFDGLPDCTIERELRIRSESEFILLIPPAVP
ncbi:MAG: hypothetical protein SF069_17960 [Phycisphaerae bacterium]|nr:hypothetical protein [Phycisphaerae bacterium]